MQIILRSILLLLFFALLFKFSFSQSNVYHPFPLDQKTEWRTDWFSIDCIDQNYSLCASRRHYTGVDSIIDNINYTKIYREGIAYLSDTIIYGTSFEGLIREDTAGKKIYFLDYGSSIELLIYDFDVKVGDTVNTFLASNLVVSSIDSMLLGNEYHRKINFENSFPHPIFVVEGMGSNGGLLATLYDGFGFETTEVLKCFQINDTTIYEDTSYNFTTCELDFPDHIYELSVSKLSVFPNPVPIGQTLFISGGSGISYTIYNARGYPVVLNHMYNQLAGIHVVRELLPPGIYFIRIQAENSIPAVLKIIIQ